MARINNLTNFLNDVSGAIKEKIGDETPIPASQFDTKIRSIETVGNYQEKSINITTNGNYNLLPDTGYDALSNARISVEVGGSMDPTTAVESDVINPKTFYSNGQKLTGSISNVVKRPNAPILEPEVYSTSLTLRDIEENLGLALTYNSSSISVYDINNDNSITTLKYTLSYSSLKIVRFSSVQDSEYTKLWVITQSSNRNLQINLIWVDDSGTVQKTINYTDTNWSGDGPMGGYNAYDNTIAVHPTEDLIGLMWGVTNNGGKMDIMCFRYNSSEDNITRTYNDRVGGYPNWYYTAPTFCNSYWTSDYYFCGVMDQGSNKYQLILRPTNVTGTAFAVAYSGSASNAKAPIGNNQYVTNATSDIGNLPVSINTYRQYFVMQNYFIVVVDNTLRIFDLQNNMNELGEIDISSILTLRDTLRVKVGSTYRVLDDRTTVEYSSLTREGTTYYNTTDADSIASNILLSKTAYVNGGKTIGTMPNNGTLSYTSTESSQTIPAGYTSGGTISPMAFTDHSEYNADLELSDLILYGGNPYLELEYIESTGTQRIDTGITPNNTLTTEIVFKNETMEAWENIFGIEQGDKLYELRLNDASTNLYRMGINGTTRTYTMSAAQTEFIKYKMTGTGSCYLNDTLLFNLNNSYTNNSNTVKVFKGSLEYGTFKLKGLKMWKANELVRDFIPVKRLSDNVICLLDNVSGNYFTNTGTGTFIAGPVKVTGYTELEYIQFASGQYINTNLIPSNHLTEIKFDMMTYQNDERLLGTVDAASYYHFTAYSNKYYWGRNGSEASGGTWTTGDHILEYNKDDNYKVVLDGTTLGSGTAITALNNLWIGRRDSSANFAGKVYYVKIYDKSTETLVRNLIPVRRTSDSAVCFYDKITSSYFTNAGTGTFTAGPDKS